MKGLTTPIPLSLFVLGLLHISDAWWFYNDNSRSPVTPNYKDLVAGRVDQPTGKQLCNHGVRYLARCKICADVCVGGKIFNSKKCTCDRLVTLGGWSGRNARKPIATPTTHPPAIDFLKKMTNNSKDINNEESKETNIQQKSPKKEETNGIQILKSLGTYTTDGPRKEETNEIRTPKFNGTYTTDGLKCVFPFIYKGELHNTCALGTTGYSWCPTEVMEDMTFEHTLNKWGRCKGPWHSSAKCGPQHPLADGTASQCDPKGPHPCCNPNSGWCGHTQGHCGCKNCVDYRRTSRLIEADKHCTIPAECPNDCMTFDAKSCKCQAKAGCKADLIWQFIKDSLV